MKIAETSEDSEIGDLSSYDMALYRDTVYCWDNDVGKI